MHERKKRTTLHRVILLLLLNGVCALMVASAAAQVPLHGAGGRTLSQLAGTDTLITVVLKAGARDVNLKVVDVSSDYISLQAPTGERTAYTFSSIAEIRVQDDRVDRAARRAGPALHDPALMSRAGERIYDIFIKAPPDDPIKLQAAAVYAASGNTDAYNFLQTLSQNPDVPTAVVANLHFYVAGGEASSEKALRGMEHGNRNVKVQAARLAGLTGDTALADEIAVLLRDPSADIFPNAARSAGHLGAEAAIPGLITGIQSLSHEKAEASAFALVKLGGEQVTSAMKTLADADTGYDWFRALKVLYALGDDTAGNTLATQAMKSVVFGAEAAVLLARAEQNWDAVLFLRDALKKPINNTYENLARQADMAVALFEAGQPTAKSQIQGLFNVAPRDIITRGRDRRSPEQVVEDVAIYTAMLIGRSGHPDLLSMLMPIIEDQNPRVALAACQAAFAIANPAFRERMLSATYPEVWDGQAFARKISAE